MEDKIRLLMEETGCDRGEAELALTSTGFSLELAIRTIPTLLRNIVVLKARFQAVRQHFYGLFLVIADIKRNRLLRVRTVASYNPCLYEVTLERDWYDFEREVFSYRLMEGTHPSSTKDLETLLNDLWITDSGNFYFLLQSGEMGLLHQELVALLQKKLHWNDVRLELHREELNLAQFQLLRKDGGEAGASEPPRLGFDEARSKLPLRVEVQLEEDPSGVLAEEMVIGDTAFSIISDERDIARYLARLLGGRSGEVFLALPTPVESLKRQADTLEFVVRLTTGIVGTVKVPLSSRLKVQRQANDSWWKRLISWSKE